MQGKARCIPRNLAGSDPDSHRFFILRFPCFISALATSSFDLSRSGTFYFLFLFIFYILYLYPRPLLLQSTTISTSRRVADISCILMFLKSCPSNRRLAADLRLPPSSSVPSRWHYTAIRHHSLPGCLILTPSSLSALSLIIRSQKKPRSTSPDQSKRRR